MIGILMMEGTPPTSPQQIIPGKSKPAGEILVEQW